jgi:hypothetical protein
MKRDYYIFLRKLLVLVNLFFVFAQTSTAQITISTANCNISSNEVQMDILVTNTGAIDLRWNSCVLRMSVPAAMIPAGTQTYTYNYMGGSDFPLSWPLSYPANSFGASYNEATRLLTWTTGNSSAYNNTTCAAPLLSPGQTKTIGRFSFKITSSNFVGGAAANFVWHTTSSCNFYQNCYTAVTGYMEESGLRTLNNPCTLIIPSNPCMVSGTVNSTAVSCSGNDGTATVYLTGPGSDQPGTFTVDGGALQSFTTNPFTLGGLTVGAHNIFVFGTFSTISCPSIQLIANVGIPSSTLAATYTYIPANVCNSDSLNFGSITVTASGGTPPYNYEWLGPPLNAPIPGNSASLNNLSSNGWYNVHVTDVCGFAYVYLTVVVNVPGYGVSTYPTSSSSCVNNGSLEVYRAGGILPFAYSLDNVNYQVSNKFYNLAPGIYTAYVKDAIGCVASKKANVQQIHPPTLTARYTNSSTCLNNGTIQANDPIGGQAPFTYSLDGSTFQSSKSFAGLAAGTYTLIVKDTKGCLGTTNVTIGLNPINVTSYAWNASSCTATNGKIQLYVTGGVNPYAFSIGGVTYQTSTNLFTNLAAGTYTGFIKDAKGCIGTKAGIVVGPAGCVPTFTNNTNNSRNNTQKISEYTGLKIQAHPNPTNTDFILVLEGYNSKEKVSVVVTDQLGRKVYQSEGMGKLQYRFGQNFLAGMYYIQVVQGNEKRSIKLVKE